MIEFLPDKNSAEAKAEHGETAVEFRAVEAGRQLARCVLTVDGLNAELFELSGSEPLITEGLVRAALNYAANRNAYTACVEARELSEESRLLLLRLGFSENGAALEADIPEVFLGGCSH